MVLKKIHHLIRYFLFLGIGAFVGYVREINTQVFLIFTGPCIYLSHKVKGLLAPVLGSANFSREMMLYVYLMPVTLLYYGVLGFMLKQLWNERGKIRFISMAGLVGFLLYIHYLSWKNLTAYLA